MKIVWSVYFVKQLSKRKDKNHLAEKINSVLMRISELGKISHQLALNYLKSQNDKKLKSAPKNIFKWRISDGDRIFYTFGSEVEDLKEKYPESLVIIGYASHDDQGRMGKHYNPSVSDTKFIDSDTTAITNDDLMCEMGFDPDWKDKTYFSEIFKDNYRRYVYDSDNIPEDLEKSDVVLSKKQAEIIDNYIEKPTATFITGGAGSGKTVIGTHILHEYAQGNPDNKCIYFTQSKQLIKKVEGNFKYIVGKSDSGAELDKIEFFELNDFIIEKLATDVTIGQIATFSDFENFLSKTNTKMPKGINERDLWAEIRGTIKGGLDENWGRCYTFNQNHYPNEATLITELEKSGFLKRLEEDKRLLTVINKNENPSNSEAKEFLEKLKKIDKTKPLRELSEYLNLSGEQTTLDVDEETRRQCYDICEKYQRWLKDKTLYDDNDLILSVLQTELSEDCKYDLIVVDEVQDYTELQLFFIKQLIKNSKGLIFTGDVHQIINPTIFEPRRLKSLISTSSDVELAMPILTTNFRMTSQIVSYTNCLAQARSDLIGKKKKSGEVKEDSNLQGNPPVKLEYSSHNVASLLNALMEFPRVAVLVANEASKGELIKIIGEEKYCGNNFDFIFTIPEIKGMEYKYVVCFDLLSSFQQTWKEILAGEAKHKTRYRYYFNLVYVAFSRAQESLCIVESGEVQAISDALYPSPKLLRDFDEGELYINQLSCDISEILAEAKGYFDNEDYERAKQRYEKAGKIEYSREIKLCDIQLLLQERQYEKALKEALRFSKKDKEELIANGMNLDIDEDILHKYISDIPKETDFYTLLEAYLDVKNYTVEKKSKSIFTIIDHEMPNLWLSEKEDLIERFIERFDNRICELADRIERKYP